MSRLIIIADDLTGAADTAACFAQAGLRTVVMLPETGFFQSLSETGFWLPSLQNPVSSGASSEVFQSETEFSGKNSVSFDVISLSTDTRQLSASEAARRVHHSVHWLSENGFVTPGTRTLFYKKVDSLMRGHPAVELSAMLDALGLDRALVAPAFPAQGRVTRAGRQVIGAGQSAQQIDLGEIFGLAHAGPATAHLVHWLSLDQAGPAARGWTAGEPGFYIADAETEADLEALAREMLAQGFRLACGSAGLARALHRVNWPAGLPESRMPPASAPARSHGVPPVLVVAGSRAPPLLRQVEAARQAGIRVLTPGLSFLEEGSFQPEELALALAETLRAGQPAILTTVGLPVLPGADEMVAGRLASVAGWLVEAGLVGGLVLTGGDTAAAVCHRLGASLIELHGEPVPGIASGSLLDGNHPSLPVITKAGAFECDLALLIEDFGLMIYDL
jgi:uncharacterized protein YgbK (DUF1537 family)